MLQLCEFYIILNLFKEACIGVYLLFYLVRGIRDIRLGLNMQFYFQVYGIVVAVSAALG